MEDRQIPTHSYFAPQLFEQLLGYGLKGGFYGYGVLNYDLGGQLAYDWLYSRKPKNPI